jgi:thioester reductase-like protein
MQTVFMTGAGGFIGRYILSHYLCREDCRLFLLERGRFADRLRAILDSEVTDPERRTHIRVIDGDITVPGLGLDTAVTDELHATMTRAIHLAAVYDLSVPKDVAMRLNVNGTRHILDFLGPATQLEQFGYMSTCAISGTFRGTFHETDFDVGQEFKNHYEEAKYLAEKLVRERRDAIPTAIFRPSYVLGHSRTGEFTKIDGPYFILVMISRNTHVVMPRAPRSKCNAPPVDYVADAFYALLEDEESVGQVYHLSDPNPLTWNEFTDLACERWGKLKPLCALPPGILRPFFHCRPFARLMGVPSEGFDYTAIEVEYDASHTTEALTKHGVVCPHVTDYIDVLVDYFKEHYTDPGVRRGQLFKDLV